MYYFDNLSIPASSLSLYCFRKSSKSFVDVQYVDSMMISFSVFQRCGIVQKSSAINWSKMNRVSVSSDVTWFTPRNCKLQSFCWHYSTPMMTLCKLGASVQ